MYTIRYVMQLWDALYYKHNMFDEHVRFPKVAHV